MACPALISLEPIDNKRVIKNQVVPKLDVGKALLHFSHTRVQGRGRKKKLLLEDLSSK
jgi:hypothetical protein